jgi:hypothetical protein
MVWAEYAARMEEITNANKIVVGKSEEKRQLRKPRRSWEDNIRIDLREGAGILQWYSVGLRAG